MLSLKAPPAAVKLSAFLAEQDVLAPLAVRSKTEALRHLAAHAAQRTGLAEALVFRTLEERERLGSTGLGGGVAIPHGRFEGIREVFACFARLTAALDFDAPDQQPVDLMCLLMAPQSATAEHLKALARVSRTLRDKARCTQLRAAENPHALYCMLTADDA